jgi:hypothetical protein
MKIKFYFHEYCWEKTKNKDASRYVARSATLQGAPGQLKDLYNSYIFEAIESDFRGKDILSCEEVLDEIKK